MSADTCRVTGALSARFVDGDGRAEMYLSGEFDLDAAPAIEQQLVAAMQAHPLLILDLSGVTFLDSSGVGVLVRAKHTSEERDVRLVVRLGDSAAVRRLLDLVGLEAFLAEPTSDD